MNSNNYKEYFLWRIKTALIVAATAKLNKGKVSPKQAMFSVAIIARTQAHLRQTSANVVIRIAAKRQIRKVRHSSSLYPVAASLGVIRELIPTAKRLVGHEWKFAGLEL